MLISFCAHIYILLIVVVSPSFRQFIMLSGSWPALLSGGSLQPKPNYPRVEYANRILSYIIPTPAQITSDFGLLFPQNLLSYQTNLTDGFLAPSPFFSTTFF